MTEWLFDYNEVLEDSDGYWWHVVDRLESIDGNKKQYELADATHTEYKTLHKDDVEGELGMFESCEWHTRTKPATENGFRVNGILCGPKQIDFWKDGDCIHEYECPDCGADGKREIDVIHSFNNQELEKTQLECRTCGYCWERVPAVEQ
jgi:hypothetical protein